MMTVMPAQAPLAMLVPETTVGVAIIWRDDDGNFGAAWRDSIDRVPMPRAEAANVLRQLADALDARSKEME